MYVHDSTLSTADGSIESINNTLTVASRPIYHWVNVNQMVLHVDETECMLRGTCQKLCNALMDNSVGEDKYIVTSASFHRLLGIHVGSKLSWKTHITHLCSKL